MQSRLVVIAFVASLAALARAASQRSGEQPLSLQVLPSGQTAVWQAERQAAPDFTAAGGGLQLSQVDADGVVSGVAAPSPASSVERDKVADSALPSAGRLVRKHQAASTSSSWATTLGHKLALALTYGRFWPLTSARSSLERELLEANATSNTTEPYLSLHRVGEDPVLSPRPGQTFLLLGSCFLSIFAVSMAMAALCLAAKDPFDPPILFDGPGVLGAAALQTRLPSLPRQGLSVGGSGGLGAGVDAGHAQPEWSSMTSYKLDSDTPQASDSKVDTSKKVDHSAGSSASSTR